MTIHPNNDEVICPACAHQFRALPVNVQAMLLTAGHTPPFMNEQKIAPVLSEDEMQGIVERALQTPLATYTDIVREAEQAVLARVGVVREQTLAEAAEACEQYQGSAETCADAIRALKGTPAAAVAEAQPVAEGYTARVIEALYENGDPVSVDAAEELSRLVGLVGNACAQAQPSSNPGPLAAVERDAERYRALVDLDWYVGPADFYCTEGGFMEGRDDKSMRGKQALDTAVDAAIAASKGANP